MIMIWYGGMATRFIDLSDPVRLGGLGLQILNNEMLSICTPQIHPKWSSSIYHIHGNRVKSFWLSQLVQGKKQQLKPHVHKLSSWTKPVFIVLSELRSMVKSMVILALGALCLGGFLGLGFVAPRTASPSPATAATVASPSASIHPGEASKFTTGGVGFGGLLSRSWLGFYGYLWILYPKWHFLPAFNGCLIFAKELPCGPLLQWWPRQLDSWHVPSAPRLPRDPRLCTESHSATPCRRMPMLTMSSWMMWVSGILILFSA